MFPRIPRLTPKLYAETLDFRPTDNNKILTHLLRKRCSSSGWLDLLGWPNGSFNFCAGHLGGKKKLACQLDCIRFDAVWNSFFFWAYLRRISKKPFFTKPETNIVRTLTATILHADMKNERLGIRTC